MVCNCATRYDDVLNKLQTEMTYEKRNYRKEKKEEGCVDRIILLNNRVVFR